MIRHAPWWFGLADVSTNLCPNRRMPAPTGAVAGRLLLLSFGLASLAASGQGAIPLSNQTPIEVSSGAARLLGHYDPTQMLRVVIALQPPHMAEEERFVQDLMDPHSPDFHRFLTAAEWNARFAPSAADEERVVEWARARGLTVTNRYSNRLLVDLEAPVGILENAFGVTINRYQVRGEVDFSNDRDPFIPAPLRDVISAVLDLNSIQRVRSAHSGPEIRGPDYSPGPPIAKAGTLQVDGKPGPARSNSVSSNRTFGFMDPYDLYGSETYDFWPIRRIVGCCNFDGSPTGSPPETSIAIAAFNTFNASDVQTFFQTFNLAGNVTWYYINGTPSGPDIEPTLDTEWSSAMANSFGSYLDTAHVFVYEGVNGDEGTITDVFNQMLSDGLTRVMSASFGCTENTRCDVNAISRQHHIFNSMVGQGWTLIAASGDSGATSDCWFANPASTSVNYPASDPNVLAVGGTTLFLDGSGNLYSEQGWQGLFAAGSCAANKGGSGGGYSADFPQPGYQHAFGASARMLPDISLAAWGTLQDVYFNGQWVGAGGTSIAAPEMAAFFVQENAYLRTIGYVCGPNYNELCGPYGQPHNALYSEGAYPSAAHNPFYDMTAGCNSNDQTLTYNLAYYCAGPGYDRVTGWGSANMMQLSWALNWERLATSLNGAPYLTFTGPPEGHWYNTDQEVSFLVNDYAGTEGPNGAGIAGYYAAWDSSLLDSSGAAHGGSGDLFYSGPTNLTGPAGCLAIGTGIHPHCTVTSEQGCHFAYVHGWNHEGWTTALTPEGTPQPETYGPLCLDLTPPATTATVLQGPTVPFATARTFTVTLNATDQYSGVASTWYYFPVNPTPMKSRPNSETITLPFQLYTGPITVTLTGPAFLHFYSIDIAGNQESIQTIEF